jgi:hypothetical protein
MELGVRFVTLTGMLPLGIAQLQFLTQMGARLPLQSDILLQFNTGD